MPPPSLNGVWLPLASVRGVDLARLTHVVPGLGDPLEIETPHFPLQLIGQVVADRSSGATIRGVVVPSSLRDYSV